jgi:hypothetical protein
LHNIGVLVFLVSVLFAALLCAALFINGVYDSAASVSWSRLWPVLPTRLIVFRRSNIELGYRSVFVIGTALTLIGFVLNAVLTIGLAVAEGAWFCVYWVVYGGNQVSEIVCRSGWYLMWLLWYLVVELIKQLAWGLWGGVCFGLCALASAGIPFALACVVVSLIRIVSVIAISTLDEQNTWIVFGWTAALAGASIVWLRYCDWLICPGEDSTWRTMDITRQSPIDLFQAKDAIERWAECRESIDNIIECYFGNRIITGWIAGILLFDTLGACGIGKFRFGAPAICIAVLCLCALLVQGWKRVAKIIS